MTKEEKNFLIGFMTANVAAGIYILSEQLLKPMPIEWRVGASILIGIIFLLSKAVIRKASWVKSVITFFFIYAMPLLQRREILYLIKKFIPIIAYNDKTKKFYIAATVLISVICLRKLLFKGFKKVMENPLLSIAAFWSAIAVLILSRCGFPKQETFFDAVIQRTAYFLGAALFAALFTHLTVFVMYIYSKIRKTKFAQSIDISFFIFGFLAAAAGIYFNSQKITDAFIKPDYLTVIKYVMLIFSLSYGAALVGSSKGIKSFWTWLGTFLENEDFLKLICDKTKSEKCADIYKTNIEAMPKGLSGSSALYTAKFIFGVRDFFRNIFGNVFGTLAPDGIIMGAVTDIFDLFTGRDNENGEK